MKVRQMPMNLLVHYQVRRSRVALKPDLAEPSRTWGLGETYGRTKKGFRSPDKTSKTVSQVSSFDAGPLTARVAIYTVRDYAVYLLHCISSKLRYISPISSL